MGAQNPTTFTLAPGMAPVAPLMRMLGRYDRQKLEAFIEISIGLLDLIDGDPDEESADPDLELAGDEEDGSCAEDEEGGHIGRASYMDGPGCPISDPGGGNVEDEGEGIDEKEPTDHYATLPIYGPDQSLGPLNEAIAAQRHTLQQQLGGWDERFNQQILKRLTELDRREAALPVV